MYITRKVFSSPVGELLALSVVGRVSYVSTITTRNNEAIKSIFSANVYRVPELCLLGIGGAPYISQPGGGASY